MRALSVDSEVSHLCGRAQAHEHEKKQHGGETTPARDSPDS
jgi:hypothetical protein